MFSLRKAMELIGYATETIIDVCFGIVVIALIIPIVALGAMIALVVILHLKLEDYRRKKHPEVH